MTQKTTQKTTQKKEAVNPRKPRQSKQVVSVEKKEPAKFDAGVVSDLVLHGDLRQFSPEQKVKYYTHLCQSLGLNPLTRPFQLIVLNGKEVLYATRDAAEQLRKINGVSVVEMLKERDGDMYLVTVKVQDNTGRYDIATGAVNIRGLIGDAAANKIMTAETKAKRRATLSICGLGMLDETEVETIPGAHIEPTLPTHKDDRLEKIKALPENIKDGLRVLGFKIQQAYDLCEANGWNHAKILAFLNKQADTQADTQADKEEA